MNSNVDAFREKVQIRIRENRIAFEGLYKEEIDGLLGLSREEIDQITPDTTDLEVYDQLITVVKEASASNIAQAELKTHITELGSIAVSIARRIPKLATILA